VLEDISLKGGIAMNESAGQAHGGGVAPAGGRRRRLTRVALSAVVAAGFMLSATVLLKSSWSAFSGKTANPDNSWETGTVRLTDNDSTNTISMFDVSGMKPGDSRTGCIVVTYTGSLDTSGVKVYIASGDLVDTKAAGATNPLSSYLKLEIYEGDVAGGFSGTVTTNTGSNDAAACAAWANTNVTADYNNAGSDPTKTLGAFAGASTGFGSAVGSWAPSGGSNATKAYKFVVTLLDDDDAQGSSVTVKVTFEAQS